MKKNAVGWFEIYVNDMQRAKKFYESVFQLELNKLDGVDLDMWAFPSDRNNYGSPGALVKLEGCSGGHNSVLVYFSCDDCFLEENRAQKNGGTIHKSKFSIGKYGYISLIQDTEGNLFGLHSMK